jgi:hypothetical protein
MFPRALLVLAALAAATLPAGAARQRDINDKVRLSLGYSVRTLGVKAQVNSTTFGVGTSINLNDTFNLSDGDGTPAISGYFRFNRKHRLDFNYSDTAKQGAAVAGFEFDFGDITIMPGDAIALRSDYRFYGAYYSYALANNGTIEAGIRIGLSFLDFDLDVAKFVGGTVMESANAAAVLPLPVAGVYASHTLHPKVFFDYELELFALSYDDYSGSMMQLKMLVNWFPLKHFGFGGGVVHYSLDVDADPSDEDFAGNIDLSYSGVDVHLSFIWGQP